MSNPARTPAVTFIPVKAIIMGVAGCGKSSLAKELSEASSWTFIEGDAFHSDANRALMKAGTPLTDDDRYDWLVSLGDALARNDTGAAMTCSALKKQYRDLLRKHVANLRFVFLDVTYSESLQRVKARGNGHFFNPALVKSQFATLERPTSESDVLVLDASLPLSTLIDLASDWLLHDLFGAQKLSLESEVVK